MTDLIEPKRIKSFPEFLSKLPKRNMMHLKATCFVFLLGCFQVLSKVEDEFYRHRVAKIDKTEVSLEEYKGKVLLIVNVASECGYTDVHYKQLQKVYDILGDSGVFEILAFPCNQFGNQEPKENFKILEFATKKYGVTFPMFAKVLVVGADAHPFWQYLERVAGAAPNWNFYKYLIDHEGNLIHAFGPNINVEDIFDKIEDLVNKAKLANTMNEESSKSEL